MTDFFTNQDNARKNTGRLVGLFVLAVIAIIVLVYLVVATAMALNEHRSLLSNLGTLEGHSQPFQWGMLWQPEVLFLVGSSTVLVVATASLYKINQLSAGGQVVAIDMAGRPIDPCTEDPLERKLLNVVEEMAIASGMPVPAIFLMSQERGINAFAAGYSPEDAVIGVTRGAIETLSRDELQGVIAHEFSHIFNGDMRLNIRLIGVIHGILVIGLIGYYLLRVSFYSGRSRRSRPVQLAVVGLALMVIGYVGTFFGHLTKAAVSRQREFLADASAVQFTRNPGGIGGALKKIGGWKKGSRLISPNAPQVSHMLFGSSFDHWMGRLMATHPALADRIQAIEPSFDGHLPKTTVLPEAVPTSTAAPLSQMAAATVHPVPGTVDAIAQIGRPTPAHLAYAQGLIASLPQRIRQAAHEPFGARAVIYSLLVNDEAKPRRRQLQRLAEHADPAVYQETTALLGLFETLDARMRLPLIDLTIPALRGLSRSQYDDFRQNVDHLILADQRIALFEWSLTLILRHHLEPTSKPHRVDYYNLQPLAAAVSTLLSTLAYAGHRSRSQAAGAFAAAAVVLNLPQVAVQKIDHCDLKATAAALEALNAVSAREKKRLLQACAACISADRQVTVEEAELFRAIADALGCPVPPLLAGQPLVSDPKDD